eukprot:1067274-Prymnesium_polylepis.1
MNTSVVNVLVTVQLQTRKSKVESRKSKDETKWAAPIAPHAHLGHCTRGHGLWVGLVRCALTRPLSALWCKS